MGYSIALNVCENPITEALDIPLESKWRGQSDTLSFNTWDLAFTKGEKQGRK